MSGILNVVAASVGGAMGVTITPDYAEGNGTASSIRTNSVTASRPGGGYTFLWSLEVGDPQISASAPLDSPTMSWSASLQHGGDATAVWKVSAYLGGSLAAEGFITVFIQRS